MAARPGCVWPSRSSRPADEATNPRFGARVLLETDSEQAPGGPRRIKRAFGDEWNLDLLIAQDKLKLASRHPTWHRPVDDQRRGVKTLAEDHAGPLDQRGACRRLEDRAATPR